RSTVGRQQRLVQPSFDWNIQFCLASFGPQTRRTAMIDQNLIRAGALAALLMATIGNAWANEPKYPDWRGQWERFVVRGIPGQPSHDQTKPGGFGQEAPLTEESARILRESLADQHEGGMGNFPTSWGRASGMPYMMMAFGPMEWVVTPHTTYI